MQIELQISTEIFDNRSGRFSSDRIWFSFSMKYGLPTNMRIYIFEHDPNNHSASFYSANNSLIDINQVRQRANPFVESEAIVSPCGIVISPVSRASSNCGKREVQYNYYTFTGEKHRLLFFVVMAKYTALNSWSWFVGRCILVRYFRQKRGIIEDFRTKPLSAIDRMIDWFTPS